MEKEHNISTLSKILLVIGALLLVSAIFLPIWKIELYAPQYPEGLELLIYANGLAGNVEIINGLNHYIGMATLHSENFIEFTLIRYILGFFAFLFIAIALLGKKKGVYILFITFVVFSVLAMADFYRWNYNYGHNLDPNAAIKVPGMTYQPPLIGYKQLLNFGAYSIPDTGGFAYIGAGVLLLLVLLMERNVFARWLKPKRVMPVVVAGIFCISAWSCSAPGPQPIKLNTDMCAYCKMTITDAAFASQLTTQKGRYYMFDDIQCLTDYKKENAHMNFKEYYVADFCSPSVFIEVHQAILLESDSLRSPMGGNIAGFAQKDSAQYYKSRFNANEITWAELLQ